MSQGVLARFRDTEGGDAVVLAATSVVVAALISRLVDGATLRFNTQGQRYVEVAGSSGRIIGAAIMLVAVALALHGIIKTKWSTPITSSYPIWVGAAVVWWYMATVLLRGESRDLFGLFETTAAVVLVVGVIASPPTRRTVQNFAYLLAFTAISLLAYGLAFPDEQPSCRPDKCGIFGSLMSGYLYQENGAARFVVLLIPAAALLRDWRAFYGTLAVATVFVLATDSRTSLTTLAVAAVIAWLIRRALDEGRPLNVPAVVRLVPFAALAASFWVLTTSSANELTGRGEIFAKIWAQQDGYTLWVGSGSDTVAGLTLRYGARAFGEHGEAPHLLVHAGLVGLGLFAAGLFSLVLVKEWSVERILAFAFILVASTQFVTEPAWELQLRTISFPIMVLTVGLMLTPLTKESAHYDAAKHAARSR